MTLALDSQQWTVESLISQGASGAAASIPVQILPGKAGDIILHIIGQNDVPIMAAQPGWEEIGRTDCPPAGDHWCLVFAHVVTRAEAASGARWNFGTTASGWVSDVVRISGYPYRPKYTGISSSAGTFIAATQPSAPSVMAPVPNSLLIVIPTSMNLGGGNRTWSPPAGMIEISDNDPSGGNLNQEISYGVVPAGPTETRTPTQSGSDDCNVLMFCFGYWTISDGAGTTDWDPLLYPDEKLRDGNL